jgi:hypothetical protein
MAGSVDEVVRHRGRPRKFSGPSRAITLTLPEEVIATLEAIDHDVSRAVVRIAQPRLARRPHPPAELAQFGGRAVIVVNRSRTLEEHAGIVLVPLSDGRALISFDDTMTPALIELMIRDALQENRLSEEEAEIFRSVGDLLTSARHSDAINLRERRIIVLEAKRPAKRRSRPKPQTRR